MDICRRLDGLPLAIELAAARLRLLSPQALCERLTHSLQVLTGGPRDLPARQQTMRATVQWSYELLSSEEQRLFRWLSIFAGGCTLQAAETLARTLGVDPGNVLDGVTSLLDKNLLYKADQGRNELAYRRLFMLETMREYGLESLAACGELEEVRWAHARYYLSFAEETEAHFYQTEAEPWFERLEREHDNFRSVLDWLMEFVQGEEADQAREAFLRLGGIMSRFWLRGGYVKEGRAWIAHILVHRKQASPAVRAKSFSEAGALALFLDDLEHAKVLCTEALKLYQDLNDVDGIGRALYYLGASAAAQGNYSLATSQLEECVSLFSQAEDTINLAFSLMVLGALTFEQTSQLTKGQTLLEKSRTLFRKVNFKEGTAWTQYFWGIWHLRQGDTAMASSLFKESLVIFRTLRYRRYIGYPLYYLGKIAALQGNLTDTHNLYKESLAMFREVDDKGGIAACLQGWGGIVAREGMLTWAAKLWGAAEALSPTSDPGESFTRLAIPGERAAYEQRRAEVSAQLEEQMFIAAWSEGQTMTPEQALTAQTLSSPSGSLSSSRFENLSDSP